MKKLVNPTLDGEAGAILSDCEQYRYRLWREWGRSSPGLGFIMLNPSTADHQVNDPTITRCLQRAGRQVRPSGSGQPVPAALDRSCRPTDASIRRGARMWRTAR
ncbi:DUF1643 domain-containing protein [Cupriavidus lacunae]|uniref:DUF1643 domain-containing protein n=1 Tax=Cupriavidus lacunae TaxID=2666307 RepID=UPI001FC90194|nr:DUF1643 domain-containing protein [Cupriavidus lacunae]